MAEEVALPPYLELKRLRAEEIEQEFGDFGEERGRCFVVSC